MHRLITILTLVFLPFCAFAELSEEEQKKIAIESCNQSYLAKEPIAFDICMPLAKENVADSQLAIANMLYWGWGNKAVRNYKKAVFWYKKSAVNGNREASYHLGVLYEKGLGVDTDYGKSFRWFLSSAKKGYAPSQFNVANMYAKGAGIRASEYGATKWYHRAAQQGEVSSQYNLANRLAIGKGVVQNIAEAYKWYMIAENYGDTDAAKSRLLLEKELTEPEKIKAMKEALAFKPITEDGSEENGISNQVFPRDK